MKKGFTILLLFCSLTSLWGQTNFKIMSYNLLNYPGTDTTTRNPYLRTTIAAVNPDIFVVQEITSQAGVDGVLNNVLNVASSGYSAGTFIDGPDTDSEIFFKSANFTFIANNPIATSLRNINEFVIKENNTGDTLRIYSVHLKASSGTTNEDQRLSEVTILRTVTDALPSGSNFLVCGDFNIYSSTEAAYTKLLDQSTQGYFVDLFNMPGTWNQSQYAPYHTQSTRVRSFGGGATGGLDDRFDMILFSQGLIDAGGITYVANSYTPYGNDGQHYNDSINAMPNTAVSQQIADALHYMSDHLPVIATLEFDNVVPVELVSFSATVNGKNVLLRWITATEINNFGFNIEKYSDNWETIDFVAGHGTSNEYHTYEFEDSDLPYGKYRYRLKQIDNDETYAYSKEVSAELYVKPIIILDQNYPNPFNNFTMINWSQPTDGFVTLKIYDVLGNEVAVLVNENLLSGLHNIRFDTKNLASGIYFYKLSVNGSFQIKKMILQK